MNHLHSFAKMTSQEHVFEQKLQLQAPPKAGTYQLDIFVKSDSYIGMDLRAVAKVRFAVILLICMFSCMFSCLLLAVCVFV